MCDILILLANGECYSVPEIHREVNKTRTASRLKPYDYASVQRAVNWLKQDKKVEYGRPPYSNKRGMGYYMI